MSYTSYSYPWHINNN